MVIPDWAALKPPKIDFVPEGAPRSEAMARPLDRLAAVIVNVFILLVPVYILLSSPFKRWLTSSFILGSEAEFTGIIVFLAGLAIALIVLYQTVLVYYFGATFGKMLFDLRVKPMFGGDKLTWSVCLGRALVWTLNCLLLGLPMLSVFTNSRRRTLHDRICETVVVAKLNSGVTAPAPWERGLVRGFFAAIILFTALVGTVQMRHLLERLRTEHGIGELVEKESGECEVVTKNLVENSSGGQDTGHERLNLAMSLYAAGLAERGCLESELEREMARQIPVGAMTYLAQAFVNADDAEVSNSYLDQVCIDAPGTVECSMSKVVNRWSEEDWTAVEELLKAAPKGSGYLEVWGVRHYMKQARYSTATTFLDELSSHQELAEFILPQRVKALYNSYLEPEASAALAQALPVLEKDEGEDLSAWMCAQQLQNGCAALEKLPCRGIHPSREISEIDFERPSAALARVMALECQNAAGMDYLTFSEAVRDQDWQTFFRANLKRQKDDKQTASRLFMEVINSNSAPELLRVEALRRVSQFASQQQMANLVEVWHGFESKESWVKAGNLLFARFMERNEEDWAMRVARYLMSSESLSPHALAQLTNIEKDSRPEHERKPANTATKTGDEEGD